MAQKGATHLPPGMCLSVTMRDSHSVRDLKQMYGKTHPGTSLDKLVITYSGRVLENNDLSITRYGVPPGEYRLVSLGKSSAGDYYSLSIVHADQLKYSPPIAKKVGVVTEVMWPQARWAGVVMEVI